jgi:glycosyltransferase involved in cell wall biosynthesis
MDGGDGFQTGSMRISVIVPAFNEERLIGETLAHIKSALVAFSRRGWETELIVCDNNSKDRTAEIARLNGAVVVFEPVNQIAQARNRGAESASGEWLIFVDADSFPSVDLFEDIAVEINSGRSLAGGCVARMETRHFAARVLLGFWNRVSRIRRVFAGWMIFCETATFRKLQGFDTRLYVSEDIDLSLRLRRLAREQGKTTVVLSGHPILTSSRKVKLYGIWRHIALMVRIVLTGGKSLKNREDCALWYDGKR